MSTVSKTIKRLRNENSMTQDQLAERMNVTRQAVSNWETEKNQPDIETIDRLAGIFKTDIYEFIYGEPNRGYRTYQRKYFVVAAICAAAILLVLSVGKFLSDYYWGQEFSEGLPLFELFNYMIPCVSETIILFLSGTMTVSVLSIWFDISAQKRKELLIIGGIIFALLSLYYCMWGRGIASNSDENYRFVLVYLQWWKRIAFLWFPPFCLGVIAFVCTNSTFCSDNS